MRASTDQVRDLTLDVVDGVRQKASGIVTHGAERVTTTLDGAASTIGDGVDRLAERAPSVALAVERPHRRHRLRTVLIASAVLVVLVAVARKLLAGGATGPDATPAHYESGQDERGETEDAEVATG